MKIGLFGGSFNPIHKDHVRIVKYTLEKKLVDEVWMMPCKIHAFGKNLASEKDRVKMIELATENLDNVKICDVELKSNSINYTADTIKQLKRQYDHQFYFIIGFDILNDIHKWYKHKQLFNEIEFIAFKRRNYGFKKVAEMKIPYLIEWKDKDISSTLVREKVRKGESLNNLVPEGVAGYIAKYKLYR
jgi:nicotinate-nucleotide adenylyltransferase